MIFLELCDESLEAYVAVGFFETHVEREMWILARRWVCSRRCRHA